MGYPSDVKDQEWEKIRHHFEFSNGYGNRAIHPRRRLVNGILYVVKTGCQWRMLPKDFPPWKTVYGYFRRLSRLGVWQRVLSDLMKMKRLKGGRNEHPSLLIIDAQSVKTAGKGEQRGFDGGKKIKGRKRQILWTYRGIFIKFWFTREISMIPKEELCWSISYFNCTNMFRKY